MTRLNLLFFAILISLMHNYYSEFNNIFLQSFFFLFLSEIISVKLFNRLKRNQQNQQNQINQDDDDSVVSNITDNEDEDNEDEDNEDNEDKADDKAEDKAEYKADDNVDKDNKNVDVKEVKTKEKEESSEETEEEEDEEDEENSDEPVDISDGGDINQMEILRLLNNYDSLGDSGLMELKNKMLELDKLVEFYKNDTKKTKKNKKE